MMNRQRKLILSKARNDEGSFNKTFKEVDSVIIETEEVGAATLGVG
jgi:hypothetical protein